MRHFYLAGIFLLLFLMIYNEAFSALNLFVLRDSVEVKDSSRLKVIVPSDSVEVVVHKNTGRNHSFIDKAKNINRRINPFAIYHNITRSHTELTPFQAASLDKFRDSAVTLAKFLQSIEALSRKEATNQKPQSGWFGSQSGGPIQRYVFDPSDSTRVIDMRHFLAIGYKGELFGLSIEIIQLFKRSWWGSAFDYQDFYSNSLGAKFYKSLYYMQYRNNELSFGDAIRLFFEARSRNDLI